MKKYKAILFDIDGTLVPNKKEGSPSKAVACAIEKASKFVHVGIATSRPYFMIEKIVDHLKLNGPSIINGGTQIIDIVTQKVYWEKCIDYKDVAAVSKILMDLKIPFVILDNGVNYSLTKIAEKISNTYVKKFKPFKPFDIWVYPLEHKYADEIIKKISHIPTISILKIPSWEDGKVDIFVTHASATKQHAICEIAKILKIKTEEIIGVGDGYNDFPLLMACGLKVAMGNSVEDIKAIADYIAPHVDEDGAAHVINKFILNHE